MRKEIANQYEACFSSVIDSVLKQTVSKNATASEVSLSITQGLSIAVRLGDVDTVEHTKDKAIGITVYFGQRKGSVSTTDTSESAIEKAVDKACEIAQSMVEDPCVGLADPELMATDYPELSLYHPWDISVDEAVNLAIGCENVGRHHASITNSDGVSLNTYQGYQMYGNSYGFKGGYATTRHNVSCVLIAGEGSGMKRDYYYTVARSHHDLENLEEVAAQAAKNTLARLNAKSVDTCQVPVIFSSEVARSLLGGFLSAVSGGQLYRKSSFLLDSLGKQIFPDWISMVEKPHMAKGLASSPFDDEGVATKERSLVDSGVLKQYILSSYSARRLGMTTTGNAGGLHNLIVSNSSVTFSEMIKHIKQGFLVTELMGHGANVVTGDYSQGASGFWIVNGEIAYPVEGVTIAGNLIEMYQNIEAISTDTDHRGTVQTGSILLNKMTVAGG